MILQVLVAVLVGLAAGDRTVLVTPRPRWYQPTKFMHEPRRDPSSPHVPSFAPARRPPAVISLRVVHTSPNSLVSANLPVEHRQQDSRKKQQQQQLKLQQQQRGPSLSERPIVVMSATTAAPLLPTNHKPELEGLVSSVAGLSENDPQPDLLLPQEEPLYVESLPSYSVQLEETQQQDEAQPGLTDYLTPPKYPSVYERQFTDVKQINALQPVKKKKKTKKRKQKLDSRERDGSRSSSSPPTNANKFKTQSSGERVEFQLHGQNGPDSYKFGFDTGAGKNRQFRFEEKDAQGHVKGHFGYYDTTGKLQIFNYRADDTGFHAEQVD